MAVHHLYFHAPCFDGIVSAVLLHEFLSERDGREIVLHPVNYHLNEAWARGHLERSAAVVDFLYHPDADIWFDHHRTSFEPKELKQHFLARHDPLVVYEPAFTSCSLLLWNRLDMSDRFKKYSELVEAADRTDSARYVSATDAVYSEAPAHRLNASLAIGSQSELEEYSCELVAHLRTRTLDEVANLPEVLLRHRAFVALRDRGMERFLHPAPPDYARLAKDGLFVFNIDGSGALISRYAPFVVAPQAHYSVGVVRTPSGSKITAMRNPWRDFLSVPLGDIFFQVFAGKGGGHERVASARLGPVDPDTAEQQLQRALGAIRGSVASQQASPTTR